MYCINKELHKWAADRLYDVLNGRLSSTIASLASLNMIFDQWAALSLQASSLLSNQLGRGEGRTNDFDWETVSAHKSLHWHPCHGGFQCARLGVPMDWQGTSQQAHRTVELALIKLEATVSITDRSYGGPVILSSGSPGSSGIGQVLRLGHAMQTILSADPKDGSTAKHFDIVGFDTRGVNNTRPALSCFNDVAQEAAWRQEKHADGYIGDTDSSFDKLWARLRGLGASCSQDAAANGIGYHMSSTATARDVLEIVERHGQWRESETKRLLNKVSVSQEQQRESLLRNRYVKGQESIQFYGLSYGTVVGARLLAMYPDKINRIALDGIVDLDGYPSLKDADTSFVKLIDYCYKAGQSNYPIWNKDGPSAMLTDVHQILATFQTEPIATPGNKTHGPALLTYHDFEAFVLDGVSNLLAFAPCFVQALHEMSRGQAPTLAEYKSHKLALSSHGLGNGESSHLRGQVESSAYYGTLCSDIQNMTTTTKAQYKDYARQIIAQSSLTGAAWSENLIPCTAWYAKATWQSGSNLESSDAVPALLIGNSHDPITPIDNAHKMSARFPSARVLQQNSEGHCSFGSISMCTGRALREYFQSGALPQPSSADSSSICEPDVLPLHGYAPTSLTTQAADHDLWNALVKVNSVWS